MVNALNNELPKASNILSDHAGKYPIVPIETTKRVLEGIARSAGTRASVSIGQFLLVSLEGPWFLRNRLCQKAQDLTGRLIDQLSHGPWSISKGRQGAHKACARRKRAGQNAPPKARGRNGAD